MAHTSTATVLHPTWPWRECLGAEPSGLERRRIRPPMTLLATASLAALLLVTGCSGPAGRVDKAGGPATVAQINLKMASTRNAQPFLDELAKRLRRSATADR